MSCDYEIDFQHRLVRTRLWGKVTHAEVTANRTRMASDPAFNPDFSQLADLRNVTEFAGTAAEVREIASYAHFSPDSRRALVAPTSAIYGMARIFASEREASGGSEQIRVFKTMEEAEHWLGLAPTDR